MQITIDTKQDTHEDIKKVIRLLTHLIGEHPTTNQPNLFEDTPTQTKDAFSDAPSNTPNKANIFGNMFENPQPCLLYTSPSPRDRS